MGERPGHAATEPEDILAELLTLDPDLRRERYYGERAIFYNPGASAPLGTIFASIKDRDGPNDRASRLSRPGVFRLAFCLGPEAYAARFGDPPPRPSRGRTVQLDSDPTALNRLSPHPVYAWMRWVQILSPTRSAFAELAPLLAESLGSVRARWARRG